jgi:hypothetical protein
MAALDSWVDQNGTSVTVLTPAVILPTVWKDGIDLSRRAIVAWPLSRKRRNPALQ